MTYKFKCFYKIKYWKTIYYTGIEVAYPDFAYIPYGK